MALSDQWRKHTEAEGPQTVFVLRDALENLRVSVVTTMLHHSCSALSSDAQRAREELNRDKAAAVTPDLAQTWFQHQPLPTDALSDELSELVTRSNKTLRAIQELLSKPLLFSSEVQSGEQDPHVREAWRLFHDLWASTSNLVGQTRASPHRLLTDLQDVVEQAGLDEPNGAEIMPIRKEVRAGLGAQQREVAPERHPLTTENAPREEKGDEHLANVTRLRDQVADETLSTQRDAESGHPLTQHMNQPPSLDVFRKVQRPGGAKRSGKEQPDGSAA